MNHSVLHAYRLDTTDAGYSTVPYTNIKFTFIRAFEKAYLTRVVSQNWVEYFIHVLTCIQTDATYVAYFTVSHTNTKFTLIRIF
jgi:hypothetical protein